MGLTGTVSNAETFGPAPIMRCRRWSSIGGGEILVIDTGVTLYASRNAANYQVSGKPACGTVATSGGGCKPFITVNGANAGIMGT